MDNPYLNEVLDIIEWEVSQNEYYRDGIHQDKLIHLAFEKVSGSMSTAEKFLIYPQFAKKVTDELIDKSRARGRIGLIAGVWHSNERIKAMFAPEGRSDA